MGAVGGEERGGCDTAVQCGPFGSRRSAGRPAARGPGVFPGQAPCQAAGRRIDWDPFPPVRRHVDVRTSGAAALVSKP